MRWLPLLLTPILLWTSTYPGRFAVSTTYIVVALVSALVFGVGDRRPAATAVAISALAVPMLASEAWGPSEVVPYLGAVALVDVAMRCRGAVTAVAATCWLAAQIVGTILHPSGMLPWRYTAVSLAISVAVPVLLGAYLRAHRDLSDAYRARALAAEQSRIAAEARARADERVALARELHDLVAHHMSSIVLRIRVARSVVDAADPRVRAAMDDIADTSAGVLADIRALLAALRDGPPVAGALGESTKLKAEINSAVERVRAIGFSVVDSIDSDLDGINAVSRLTLLRVVQESLTNVMKYGDRRQNVEVTVNRTGSGVTGRVVSRGNAARDGSQGTGYGLVGMSERAELAGGTLSVGPVDGEWVVQVWLPDVIGSR